MDAYAPMTRSRAMPLCSMVRHYLLGSWHRSTFAWRWLSFWNGAIFWQRMKRAVTPCSGPSRYVYHFNSAVNKSFRSASTGVSIMQDEAKITVNGTGLTNNEARVVRLALTTFADILANQLGLKDDGIALTDRYQTDTSHVLALIEGRAPRTQ